MRAIGVSNYCEACLDCLAGEEVQPMVNQVQYHVGMGPDPQGFVSSSAKRGIVMQAWSPLGAGGHGSGEILNGNLTTAIAKKHGKSTAQIALKYLVTKRSSVVTKSANPTHLAEDLDIFDFDLDEADLKQLVSGQRNKPGKSGRGHVRQRRHALVHVRRHRIVI